MLNGSHLMNAPTANFRLRHHCGSSRPVPNSLMTDEQQPAPDGVQMQLSPEEALVLFGLLSRWCEEGSAPTPEASCFESTAEGAVLHGLLADLETQLAAHSRQITATS
ncbi:hypothetical protein [Rhizobium etli]|uniref:hypothetical protein n=1 Tax=Rhizobium etli TaxID=29449 RepID=UPI001FCC0D07|nr:hypothetical protein [Rhizobium etli]